MVTPITDFTTESFSSRREPMKDLITTFSDLYINSDEESERGEDNAPDEDLNFPPPPPPQEERDESDWYSSSAITTLNARITYLEAQLTDLLQRGSEKVSSVELEKQCRKLEDKVSYLVQRECERVKLQLEMLVKDLGQSMVDCLKRRDRQLEHKFQSMRPPSSTPVTPSHKSLVNVHRAKSNNLTYIEQSTQSNQSSIQYNPPVKLEFPSFTNSQEDDPVVFVEQCEEYFAVRPLSEEEILASLTAVLKGTAKDWWVAERRKVSNWKQFKERFLSSFLSEDHDDVAARKLLERKQGVKESVRDFAFHYRALCMRWRKEMNEKEIVQAILRNCNPRLASLLRGTIKDVEELVRIGTQIERDFDESKRYWCQANGEEQRKKAAVPERQWKPPYANNQVVQACQHSVQRQDFKNITIPIVLQGRYVVSIIDTGSTFSLIQESETLWKQLCRQEPYQASKEQYFLLANGQRQTAVGKVNWKCEVQEQAVPLTLYIMRDIDLTVPVILGIDFLLESRMILDFSRAHYSLPTEEGTEGANSFPFLHHNVYPSLHFYFAITSPGCNNESRQQIQQLVQAADTEIHVRKQLKELLLSWPSVCTQEIGRTNVVKHRIITTDEVPVWRRAYKVSREKQQFIELEVQELLKKSYSNIHLSVGFSCSSSPKKGRRVQILRRLQRSKL